MRYLAIALISVGYCAFLLLGAIYIPPEIRNDWLYAIVLFIGATVIALKGISFCEVEVGHTCCCHCREDEDYDYGGCMGGPKCPDENTFGGVIEENSGGEHLTVGGIEVGNDDDDKN